MITSPTAYWQIVLACLTRLEKVSAARARDVLTNFRKHLQNMPETLWQDMVFHNEPWQLALQLAGVSDEELRQRRLSEEERRWYDKTMDKAISDASAVGTENELGIIPSAVESPAATTVSRKPKTHKTTITCACGAVYETISTVQNLRIGICAACHPFFTGEQRAIAAAGRVDKFAQRYVSPRKRRTQSKVEASAAQSKRLSTKT